MRALALLLAVATPAAAQEAQMHHATGTFQVTITTEAQAPAPAGGMPTARMAIAKTFGGDLVATAIGTMLSAGVPQPGHAAAYVAIDQINGTLAGRSGGFLLLHQGTMSQAGSVLTVVIAPGSGTGGLTGIAGSLSIEVRDGVHHYDLAYSLPASH
ncbi:DUF3224 domain-containing protein [Sphingomonas sp.]|uniref:DUF3224 domain-containing protein n=1 Tax=Sphingomonas sp. TaxID=28214 RepID=UPI003CC654D4